MYQKEIIYHFQPISLNEMDAVRLMDRTDTKFVFSASRLGKLLMLALPFYKILEINGQRDFSYSTTYLDTHNFHFFNQHMCKRTHRHKVRFRTYEATGVSYLEVKCKTNKKRTIKSRIENKFLGNEMDSSALEFLKKHIHDEANCLAPVLKNSFNRITLVGIETKERITIDYNLSFGSPDLENISLPFLAVAELKREGFSNVSPFLSILRKMEIRKSSFSKYCIGSALLRPMSKVNNLKCSFLQLKKIENDAVVGCNVG